MGGGFGEAGFVDGEAVEGPELGPDLVEAVTVAGEPGDDGGEPIGELFGLTAHRFPLPRSGSA
ncbi:MAG: hypothetical protein H6703_09125 [Myxococcales bacterium]|nr:hypothetical protein [Myxococcales bacterium]